MSAAATPPPVLLLRLDALDDLESAFDRSAKKARGAGRYIAAQRATLTTVLAALKSAVFLEIRRHCEADEPVVDVAPVDRALADRVAKAEAAVAAKGREVETLRRELQAALPARIRTRQQRRTEAVRAAVARADTDAPVPAATAGGKRSSASAAAAARPAKRRATLAAAAAEDVAATVSAASIADDLQLLREAAEDVALSFADQGPRVSAAIRNAEDTLAVLEQMRRAR